MTLLFDGMLYDGFLIGCITSFVNDRQKFNLDIVTGANPVLTLYPVTRPGAINDIWVSV